LNAQNQYFNAAVSLTSARGVLVFADYQLLAAMGTLIEYLKAPPPVDAAPLDTLQFGLPAYQLPTVRFNLPQTGSEPLRVANPAILASTRPAAAYAALEPKGGGDGFKDRWPGSSPTASVPGASEWIAQQKGGSADTPTVITSGAEASSYAATTPPKPHWLLSAFPSIQK
jgi:adhesin transport system outer membrane protein